MAALLVLYIAIGSYAMKCFSGLCMNSDINSIIQSDIFPVEFPLLKNQYGHVGVFDHVLGSFVDHFQGPRTAYLLMAHNTATMNGLVELLEALYRPYNLYVIHIDSKVNAEDFDKIQAIIHEKFFMHNQFFQGKYNAFLDYNIEFLSFGSRVNVSWGTFSIVEAELNMLKFAQQWNNIQADPTKRWELAINLCGESYLVHSMSFIEAYLLDRIADQNLESDKKYAWLGNFENLDVTSKYRKNNDIPAPQNASLYKGSQWVILPADLVYWLFETDEGSGHLQEWETYFRNFYIPDESFFQSLVMSAPREYKRYALPGLDITILPEQNRYPSHLYLKWDSCLSYNNPRPGKSPCYIGLKDKADIGMHHHLFFRKVYYKDAIKDDLIENIWKIELEDIFLRNKV